MNSSSFRNEGWLYWLAFLIALGFRLIQLGASPLTDSESTLALQALQIAQGNSPLLGPQPGYILLTSILFAVINTTNFMARFVSALVGSVLVFTPYFFRDKIKPGPALILAFLLAIDPGLVALSRQASGTMLAVTFLLFTWAMWRNRRLIPAGIFAGLALLSGPSLWAGVLVFGLTWLFLQGMSKPAPRETVEEQSPLSSLPNTNYQLLTSQYRPTLLALLITLLFGGTLFFLSPNGLSAWLSALPEYLEGWTAPSSMSAGRVLLAFLAYEPLGIFLAVFALIRGYRTNSRRILRLSLWLGVALLLAVFYRQVSELAWVIIPLLTLAALELSRAFNILAEERVEVGVVVLALMTACLHLVRRFKDRPRSIQQSGVNVTAALWRQHSSCRCLLPGFTGRVPHHYPVCRICCLWLVCAYCLAGDDMGVCDLPGGLQPGCCLGRKWAARPKRSGALDSRASPCSA
jgi:hypothetical protein